MAARKKKAKRRSAFMKNAPLLSIMLVVLICVFAYIFGNGENFELNRDASSAGNITQSAGILTVNFIDVGQGDSILIETWQNEFMLIDTGEKDQYEILKSYLNKRGVDKFKYVIFTHPHSDHIGSADKIVKEYEIETLIMPDVKHTTNIFTKLIAEIEAKNMKITVAKAGGEYVFGDAEFVIISPVREDYGNLNDHSAAIKMTHGGVSFLFTGDMEKTAEKDVIDFCETYGTNISADVLKVAHHGSSTSSIQEILDLIRPRAAVIMCDGKSYNHPHAEVVERIEAMGIEIYRTDLNGSTVIISDGEKFTVNTEVGNKR